MKEFDNIGIAGMVGKIRELEQENEIYYNLTTNLCNMLLEEIDKDGYCRIVVKKEEVEKLLESLPKMD